jgi:hypothetical protein
VLIIFAQSTFDEIQELSKPPVELDIGLYLMLLAIGFLVGFVGNIYKSRFVTAIGIALIFAAVIVAPLISILSR